MVLLIIQANKTLNAQQAPGLQWQHSYWAWEKPAPSTNSNHAITKDESGEDWVYDITTSYKKLNDTISNQRDGYILCGYTTLTDMAYRFTNCNKSYLRYSNDNDQVQCNQPEKYKWFFRAKMMKIDEQGKPLWYKVFHTDASGNPNDYRDEKGELWQVIQLRGCDYLVCGRAGWWDDGKGTAININGYPSLAAFDRDSAYCNEATDIISFNNVNYPIQLANKRNYGYLARIDNQTGNIVWESIYTPYDTEPTINNTLVKMYQFLGEFRSVTELENGEIVAFGHMGHQNNVAFFGTARDSAQNSPTVYGGVFNYQTNTFQKMHLYSQSDTKEDDCSEAILHSNGKILLGTSLQNEWETNPSNPLNTREAQMLTLIEIDPASMHQTGSIALEQVKAYDLKVGLVELSNHQIAVVSTTVNKLISNNPISDTSACTTCPNQVLNRVNFETDPLVYKVGYVNGSLTPFWKQTWDGAENKGDCFPANVRGAECVYRIVEAVDGGLIVCGNNTDNFDDDYIAKLYPEAQNQASYTQSTTDTITINSAANFGPGTYRGEYRISGNITLSGTYQFALSQASGILEQVGIQPPNGTITRLVITTGSKLILDNATLKGLSLYTPTGQMMDYMWNGILVEDGAEIELKNSTLQDVRGHGAISILPGGKIIANGSTFLNNRLALVFYPSFTATTSYIENCTFSCTDPMLDDCYYNQGWKGGAQIVNVSGVHFGGCIFENSMPFSPFRLSPEFSNEDRGYGIWATDATVLVDDFVGTGSTQLVTPKPSEFNNLKFGVVCNNYSLDPSNALKVYNAQFKNTRWGIYSNKMYNERLSCNEFLYDDDLKIEQQVLHYLNADYAAPAAITLDEGHEGKINSNTINFNLSTDYLGVYNTMTNTQNYIDVYGLVAQHSIINSLSPPYTPYEVAGNTLNSQYSGLSHTLQNGFYFSGNHPTIEVHNNAFNNLNYAWQVNGNNATTIPVFADQGSGSEDNNNTAPNGSQNEFVSNIGLKYFYNSTLNSNSINPLLPIQAFDSSGSLRLFTNICEEISSNSKFPISVKNNELRNSSGSEKLFYNYLGFNPYYSVVVKSFNTELEQNNSVIEEYTITESTSKSRLHDIEPLLSERVFDENSKSETIFYKIYDLIGNQIGEFKNVEYLKDLKSFGVASGIYILIVFSEREIIQVRKVFVSN